jgi:hypothetical protein
LNNPLAGTDPSGFATCSITDNADQCLDQNGKNTIVAADGKTVVGELNFDSKNVTFSPTSAARSFGVMNTLDGTAFGNGAQGMTSLGAPGATSRGGFASTADLLGQGKSLAQKAGAMASEAGRAMFPEVAGFGDSGMPSRSWRDRVGGGVLGFYNSGARLVNSVYSVGIWAITGGQTSLDIKMFSTFEVPDEMRGTAAAVEASTALLSLIRVGAQGAARGATRYGDDAARVVGRGPNRIYSARELVRRAEEPGPFHNFPESFNESIFRGNRQVISDDYVLYTQRGVINGVEGTFEIGVRPSASGGTEVIMHRFFRPDP